MGLSNFIFCFYHLIQLTELSKHVKVIQDDVIPFIEKYHILSEYTFFREDNSTIHTFPVAKRFKNDNGIEVIDCLDGAPDLNPI